MQSMPGEKSALCSLRRKVWNLTGIALGRTIQSKVFACNVVDQLPETVQSTVTSAREGLIPLGMVSEKDKQVAMALKLDGNKLFALGKFQTATEKYTESLTMWPDWTGELHLSLLVVHTVGSLIFRSKDLNCDVHVLVDPLISRATCYKKKEMWDKVEIDCRKALSLNGTLTKAHFFLGLALEKQYDLDEAIKHLTKELARVKYSQWEQAAKHRKEDRDYLRDRLFKMMEIVHKQEMATSVDLVNTQCRQDKERAGFERILELAAHQDVPTEPSNTFTCNLTMEVYREPVIVPSGLSYERAALTDHLSKVGQFDPVSREYLYVKDITPNLALRAATQEYLDEHPWAWEECV